MPQARRLLGAGRSPLQRHPRPGTLIQEKQQAGLRRNGHLRVIACRFKFAIPLRQRRVQLVGALQRRAQHRRTHAMKLTARRVQHQQPLLGKDPGVEPPECLGKGMARLVGLSQRFCRVGLAQQLPRLIHQRGNPVVQHHAAYRPRRSDSPQLGWGIDQLAQLAPGRKAHMVDLGKVVVFRSQPEDGRVGVAAGEGAEFCSASSRTSSGQCDGTGAAPATAGQLPSKGTEA